MAMAVGCTPAVRMRAICRQIHHLAVMYASLGDDVVSKLLYISATPFEYRDLHTAFVVEMHVKRRLCEIVTFVVIPRQAFWQFAFLVVIEVDERGDTLPREIDLNRGLLQARAGEIAYCFRTVGVTARCHVMVKLGGKLVVDGNGHALHRTLPNGGGAMLSPHALFCGTFHRSSTAQIARMP